jgi:4-hydroxy-2-oxoheptanedioate aldolase
MVRVSGNDHALIGKLLDAGSDGVIVPGVNNVAETQQAVNACRYPPHGQRSLGPIRPGLGVNPEALEARALCLVMIETKEGLENVEEICKVPGLSGIYIGPGDLSHGLGMDPGKGFSTNQLEDAYGRISAACKANKLVLGSHSIDAKFSHQCVAWPINASHGAASSSPPAATRCCSAGRRASCSRNCRPSSVGGALSPGC